MKTKNNDNEVVTRGILREAFEEFEKKFTVQLVATLNAGFVPPLLEKIGILIDTKIDKAIGDLAIMIQNGFMATAKQEDLLALTERVDNYERERKNDHADTLDLKIRVGKLEKKVK